MKDRTGLYIMIVIVLLNTCSMAPKVDRMDDRLERIETAMHITER